MRFCCRHFDQPPLKSITLFFLSPKFKASCSPRISDVPRDGTRSKKEQNKTTKDKPKKNKNYNLRNHLVSFTGVRRDGRDSVFFFFFCRPIFSPPILPSFYFSRPTFQKIMNCWKLCLLNLEINVNYPNKSLSFYRSILTQKLFPRPIFPDPLTKQQNKHWGGYSNIYRSYGLWFMVLLLGYCFMVRAFGFLVHGLWFWAQRQQPATKNREMQKSGFVVHVL